MTALAASIGGDDVPLGFAGMPGWALVTAVATTVVAITVYIVLARALRVREITDAWTMVRAKLPLPGSKTG